MKELLWLIPTLPLLGATVLILFGSRLTRLTKSAVPVVGAGSVAIAAVFTILIGIDFLSGGDKQFVQTAWQWMDTGGLSVAFSFHLDALSLVFIFVITFVGFLIHVYSAEFM